MGDAIVSTAVGASFWAVAATAIGVSVRRLRGATHEQLTPMMGVLGAFVFAAQMINFPVPGTGSSGHLGGGLLLAVLLGPHAGFLVMVSILIVQALMFVDGGLLALGCNVVNVALVPCYVVYPLVYLPLRGEAEGGGSKRALAAAVVAAVVALQLGSLGVVLQAWLSEKTALSLGTFAVLMQSIHLPIGLAEGVATHGILRTALIKRQLPAGGPAPRTEAGVRAGILLAATVVLAGVVSWFASDAPDGLEWSIEQSTVESASPPSAGRLQEIQERVAPLPDYAVVSGADPDATSGSRIDPGRSVAGLIGALTTLLLGIAVAFILKRTRKAVNPATGT